MYFSSTPGRFSISSSASSPVPNAGRVNSAARINNQNAALLRISALKIKPETNTNKPMIGTMMGRWLKMRWRCAWFIVI
jgi:hypothetical protein